MSHCHTCQIVTCHCQVIVVPHYQQWHGRQSTGKRFNIETQDFGSIQTSKLKFPEILRQATQSRWSSNLKFPPAALGWTQSLRGVRHCISGSTNPSMSDGGQRHKLGTVRGNIRSSSRESLLACRMAYSAIKDASYNAMQSLKLEYDNHQVQVPRLRPDFCWHMRFARMVGTFRHSLTRALHRNHQASQKRIRRSPACTSTHLARGNKGRV
jgi:hypothetical protein